MAVTRNRALLVGGVFAVAAIAGALFMDISARETPAAEPRITTVADATRTVEVYKSPTCGCCTAWVEHLQANGFTVNVTDLNDLTPIKLSNGITHELASCHTALVGGYVIEGHVPAREIVRLLDERPPVVGLAVPGMPMGSPGMEGPRSEPYDVLSYDRNGNTRIFASYRP